MSEATKTVPTLRQVGVVLILTGILVVALAPHFDPDFWWHLKVGQYIATEHAVPSRDFLSYTFQGHAWTDHEWLAEVSLYGLYRLAGLWGPIVAFALVVTATFVLVLGTVSALRVNYLVGLFVVSGAYMASSASWGPRIQMLTLFFLALYGYLLARYRQSGNYRWLWPLPVSMFLWVNLHGGFVLGLGLLAVTISGLWLNSRFSRPNERLAPPVRPLVYAGLATLCVTILNPNGIRQLLYPLTFVLPNPFTNAIQESASPNFHMPVMMMFEAMLLLLVACAFVARPRLRWDHLLVVLAFTHLALSQSRNVAVWSVVVSPVVAYYLQLAWPSIARVLPARQRAGHAVAARRARLLNISLLLLGLTVFMLEATRFITPAALNAQLRQDFPVGAVQYMKAHSLPSRLFVSYSWSGYVLWSLFPRYQDFMDSRADTLFDAAILRQYLAMYGAGPSWRSDLARSRAQVVLIERSAPLTQLLRLDPQWRVVYHDDSADLFVHR